MAKGLLAVTLALSLSTLSVAALAQVRAGGPVVIGSATPPGFFTQPPMFQPSGLGAFMAHQNQFQFPTNGREFFNNTPMVAPTGLAAFLARRNAFQFPTNGREFFNDAPMVELSGLPAFLAKQQQFSPFITASALTPVQQRLLQNQAALAAQNGQ